MGCQQLLGFLDYLLAIVLSHLTNVRICNRKPKHMRKPFIGLFSGHNPLQIDFIEMLMCLASECAYLLIGQRAHGNGCAGMNTYIGITCRIILADIQHSFFGIVKINPISAF